MHEHDVTRQLLDAMRSHGIDTDAEIVADGKIHRFHVKGDRRGSRNGWLIAHCDDKPAGAFGSMKEGTKYTWSAQGATELTPEQRREWKRKMEQAKRDRAAAERKAHEDAAALARQMWNAAELADNDHPYLQRKAVKSHGLKVGAWPVTSRETGEITIVSKLALLVPIRASLDDIRSLQAIFPNDRNPLHRDKDFLRDGEKRGLFFTIGSEPLDSTILLCEGYATGATLHECTGHLVVVAFDAGNLEPVAKVFRAAMPDLRIVICADNDQWTERPVKNPGVTRAFEAADAVNGLVAVPQFADLASKPTDFNDLCRAEGEEAVRTQIDRVLVPARVNALTAPAQPPAKDATAAENPPSPPPRLIGTSITDLEKLGRFQILGYDHGTYFIFHYGKKQILTYTKSDFTENGLIEVAEINFWEENFPAEKGVNRKAAFNWFVSVAHARGIYDIRRIRGRGAWMDEGRVIYHHGGYLTVDNQRVAVTDINSRYVYELKESLPDPDERPLSDEDGKQILNIAKMFRWAKPASAVMLAGWAFLAPICGVLRWRPHIWITGSAGTGQSTVLIRFVKALVGEAGIFAQGNSTEAGIRQELMTDAIPVTIDEGEQNEEADIRRVQAILSLIRQASTESQARTLKGTPGGHALRFLIRSMFCLGSIQVGIKHQADVDRLTLLVLDSGGEDPKGEWAALDEAMHTIIGRDRTISARLLRRAINMLPTINHNIEVFTTVAAAKFGRQRDGDQYGTMLAGAWSMTSSAPATEAEAARLIDSYDWSEHRDRSETDESMLALSALMEAHIRVQGGADVTVYELVCAASDVGTSKIPRASADAVLLRHGMRVTDGFLALANSSNEPRRLVADSSFAADLRGMLLRIAGADRNANKTMKFNGVDTKCIRVPIANLIADEPPRIVAPEGVPDGRWDWGSEK